MDLFPNNTVLASGNRPLNVRNQADILNDLQQCDDAFSTSWQDFENKLGDARADITRVSDAADFAGIPPWLRNAYDQRMKLNTFERTLDHVLFPTSTSRAYTQNTDLAPGVNPIPEDQKMGHSVRTDDYKALMQMWQEMVSNIKSAEMVTTNLLRASGSVAPFSEVSQAANEVTSLFDQKGTLFHEGCHFDRFTRTKPAATAASRGSTTGKSRKTSSTRTSRTKPPRKQNEDPDEDFVP